MFFTIHVRANDVTTIGGLDTVHNDHAVIEIGNSQRHQAVARVFVFDVAYQGRPPVRVTDLFFHIVEITTYIE